MNKVPDRIGVQIGYRIWRIYPEVPGRKTRSNMLLPLFDGFGYAMRPPWNLNGVTTAECKGGKIEHPGKSAPVFECYCGLHGYYKVECAVQGIYTPQWYKEKRGYYNSQYSRKYHFAGAALFWGRIIHHEKTSYFRAEFAQPIAILYPNWNPYDRNYKAVSTTLINMLDQMQIPALNSPEELQTYAEREAERWVQPSYLT